MSAYWYVVDYATGNGHEAAPVLSMEIPSLKSDLSEREIRKYLAHHHGTIEARVYIFHHRRIVKL